MKKGHDDAKIDAAVRFLEEKSKEHSERGEWAKVTVCLVFEAGSVSQIEKNDYISER